MVAIFSEIFNMSQWTTWFENNPYFHKYIVVCLSTPWGINNKSEVDIHLAVINDKRSSKSATSLSHSHSLTNWYTGYMHDDQ